MDVSTSQSSRGPAEQEDSSVFTSTDADAEQRQPRLSRTQVNSPRSEGFLLNRPADSHSPQLRFHQNANGEDRLIPSSHSSKVDPAPKAKQCLQSSRASNLSPSEAKMTPRFSPYFVPQKPLASLPKPPNPLSVSSKSSKSRKSPVMSEPRSPKYPGLGDFVAPMDLVSDMIPCNNTLSAVGSTPPSLVPASSFGSRRAHMGLDQQTESLAAEDHQFAESSQTPIDFLKYLDCDGWELRKQDLLRMVEDRKIFFLSNGFAETSGKLFQPDEPAIEKKPIPNRWVWYMHLSTDYDKAKNTRVPPGGPAGYLKYGWDRLGPAGKQPYQELADIYSAQRLKFMAEHGIKEDIAKKKPKQPAKPKTTDHTSQNLVSGSDNKQVNIMFRDEPHSPNSNVACPPTVEPIERQISHFVIDPSYVPIQPCVQSNFLYETLDRFSREKARCDYYDGPSEMFGMGDSPSYSNCIRSSPTMSDFFPPLYQEDMYAFQSNKDSNEVYGSPMGLPSSPRDHSFTCTPGSIICYQASSEFHPWTTLSSDSINSAPCAVLNAFPSSRMNQALIPVSDFNGSSLPASFAEPLGCHDHSPPVHH